MASVLMYEGFSGAWSSDGTTHYEYHCSVEYDDAAKVLTVTAEGTGPTPRLWTLTTLLGNNQTRTDSLLPIYNRGPQTFNNVNLKLDQSKGGHSIISVNESFAPA